MKREAYLGLDVGGTGAKAGVIDRSGWLLGISQRSYQPELSEVGHVEIPIATIYAATRKAAVRQSARATPEFSLSRSPLRGRHSFPSMIVTNRFILPLSGTTRVPLTNPTVWIEP